jgi:hypothetical protein
MEQLNVETLLAKIERECHKTTRRVRLDFEILLASERKITLPEAKRLVDQWLQARDKLAAK